MSEAPIYLDHHATTPLDGRVWETMVPYFAEKFGNPHSTNHAWGWTAAEAVDQARNSVAALLGATANEIVFTSGATESNNLALFGIAERSRRRGNHLVSVTTEHKSVLDPLARLARTGYDVTLLEVAPASSADAGRIDVDQVAAAIRDDTVLVSVMLANNEIGTLQPIAELGRVCRERGVPLHSDATQAVGKLPVDVDALGVDLLSFSAHKFYGPKGVGALFVRRRERQVRLQPRVYGGGHEQGLRSGTLNVPGIVGLARALEIARHENQADAVRLGGLRDRLWHGLQAALPEIVLNGPVLNRPELRLSHNLNVRLPGLDGEALLMSLQGVALSSGAACTSANPAPSHVLQALGLDDDAVRCSLRFGLGRGNTEQQVDRTVVLLTDAVARLQRLSG